MASRRGAIPAAPRKTLLQWIEADDGDASICTRPVCASATQALHARIALDPARERHGTGEALSPPAGLRLPPLG